MRAVGQLAAARLEERLAGIYALKHLLHESRRDHETVVDVLAAFVRERSPHHRSPGHEHRTVSGEAGFGCAQQPWTC